MRGIFDAVYNGAVYNVLFMRYRFLTQRRSGQHHIVSARDGRRRATRRSPRRSRSPHRSRSSLLSGTLERGGTLGLRVVSWHFSQPSPTERCACTTHYCGFARE